MELALQIPYCVNKRDAHRRNMQHQQSKEHARNKYQQFQLVKRHPI